MNVLLHAPLWVWLLLVALVWLGIAQSRPRQVTLRRASLLPVAMVGLAVNGLFAAFPGHAVPLAAWAAGTGVALLLGRWLAPWRGIRWSAETQRLDVPGSWLPLALMLAIFTVKFAVGASLAMHPALARNAAFAAGTGLAYGFGSGAFLGRSLAMWAAAHRGLRTVAV